MNYCDKLYQLEKSFKKLCPSKRRKKRQKHSKPIIDEFFKWIETSWFTGKSALVTAAEYTLKRADGLKAFLYDGRMEIDNNAAENAIRPNVLGRKNWLFSFSEAGAQVNAICLSMAETAKSNGVDFYEHLKKLLMDLPNLDIHQSNDVLENSTCLGRKISKKHVATNKEIAEYSRKIAWYSAIHDAHWRGRYFFIFRAYYISSFSENFSDTL